MNVRLLLASLAVTALLSGCLSIETHIAFEDRESGTITNMYRIESDYIVDDAVESPSGELPLPVSQADARSTARLVDGLELESYDRSQDGEHEVIEITFRFDSIAALNRVYATVPGDEAIGFEGETYRQRIGEAFDDGISDDASELLGVFVEEDDNIRFSVSFAESIAGVSEGSVESDSSASLERSLTDVIGDSGSEYWEIELE
ncbi:MAG: hypothetical protein ACLFM0_01265 [Spirochaetales bacterium]